MITRDIEQLGELLGEFKFCQMVTLDGSGEMTSRPMTLQEPRPDAPLWFVATKNSVPGMNLMVNPKVNLSFHRDTDHAWISLTGRARINDSKKLINDLWRESWNIFLGDHDKNDIILLEIEPSNVTFWEPEKGRFGQFVDILKAHFTDSTVEHVPTKSCTVSKTELAAVM